MTAALTQGRTNSHTVALATITYTTRIHSFENEKDDTEKKAGPIKFQQKGAWFQKIIFITKTYGKVVKV